MDEGSSYRPFYSTLRFSKEDIPRLKLALGLTADIITPSRFRVAPDIALLIVLRRLAYPARWVDLQGFFRIRDTVLCEVFNVVICRLSKRFRRTLHWDTRRLTRKKLKEFARALHDAGVPFANCIGFIDGSIKEVCRPVQHQRVSCHAPCCLAEVHCLSQLHRRYTTGTNASKWTRLSFLDYPFRPSVIPRIPYTSSRLSGIA